MSAEINNAGMVPALRGKRVALVHHWLMSMRGGEKVLQALGELAPDAPIYTLMYEPDELSPALRARRFRTSFLQHLPGVRSRHRYALPLYVPAARSLDCRDFDVVLCSDAAVVKAVRCRPDALLICYCHSPMRYAWDQQADYRRQMSIWPATALRVMGPYLRRWDRRSADSVTAFIANSNHVRERIRRCYGRPSVVIHPPVRLPDAPAPAAPEPVYLVVSELVEYKRVDLAVEACTRTGRRLLVVGDGPTYRHLARRSGPTVQMLGRLSDGDVSRLMGACRALLFCGEEDFGLVPVEAQGHGRPVIALGRGGALETVLDGRTGLFFAEPRVDDVVAAIERFERCETIWPPEAIHRHARTFGPERFAERMVRFLDWAVRTWEASGPQGVRRACEAGRADEVVPE